MLTHPTLDQMQTLGLAGMATAYKEMNEAGHPQKRFNFGLLNDAWCAWWGSRDRFGG